MNNLDLKTIVKKISHVDKTEWSGYLQPAEAYELKKAGAIFSAKDVSDMERFIERGHTKPRYWYFKLTDTMQRTLRAM